MVRERLNKGYAKTDAPSETEGRFFCRLSVGARGARLALMRSAKAVAVWHISKSTLYVQAFRFPTSPRCGMRLERFYEKRETDVKYTIAVAASLMLPVLSEGSALATGATAAFPAGGDADGITTCTLDAISSDKDPNGLDIRAGPGTDNAVIGRIPPPRNIEGEEFAGEVTVTGSKDGWFRITHAVMPDYIHDNDEVVFDGEGWVSGRYLYSWVEEQYLHSGPSTGKPVIADLHKPGPNGDSGGTDNFQVEYLHACLGNWVEVEGVHFGHRLHGWTYGTCSSQVTTCGGGHIPDPN